MAHTDPLTALFLICFLSGAALTTLTFLLGLGAGVLHIGPIHLHGHVSGAHIGHGLGGATFHGNGLAPSGAGHVGAHAGGNGPDSASPFNTLSIFMFLTWFGGVGYLLHVRTSLIVWLVFAVAIIVGLAAGGAIFYILAKVLMPHQTILDPRDYEMVGTVARVTATIRAQGTGEIVFIKGGSRLASAARSDDGAPLDKGTEVVVVRYERGIAFVQPWSEFMEATSSTSEPSTDDVEAPAALKRELGAH
jgi:membrane protein implicated in regulation of membrane protease activity